MIRLLVTQSERSRKVTLAASELDRHTIPDARHSSVDRGRPWQLGLQACALRFPDESHPSFGLSISCVDPLLHPLAVLHDSLLTLARDLPTDDPRATTTILAGLVKRESPRAAVELVPPTFTTLPDLPPSFVLANRGESAR